MCLVFRDKSFCNKHDCVKCEKCPDYLSEHIKKMAEKTKLPISFMKDPDCYMPKK